MQESARAVAGRPMYPVVLRIQDALSVPLSVIAIVPRDATAVGTSKPRNVSLIPNCTDEKATGANRPCNLEKNTTRSRNTHSATEKCAISWNVRVTRSTARFAFKTSCSSRCNVHTQHTLRNTSTTQRFRDGYDELAFCFFVVTLPLFGWHWQLGTRGRCHSSLVRGQDFQAGRAGCGTCRETGARPIWHW